MSILSPLALAISLLINAPALWDAFNYSSVDITSVLLRFIVITLIVGVGLSLLNRVWAAYSKNPVITMTPLVDEMGMPLVPGEPMAADEDPTVIQGENLNSTSQQSNAA